MAPSIGPLTLEHPFILAPMAGITHVGFRVLMRHLGSSAVISELISANGLHFEGQKTQLLCAMDDAERPVGMQIFGEDGIRLAQAAHVLQEKGADFIDINLGCPVPKIVKKGAGAALCRDPAKLYDILKIVVQKVKIPVSIKIRTGWELSTRNAHEVVQVAYDAGIAFVAIHGRTRAQGYSGLADWDYIAEVKHKAKLPIIGNGDIHTAHQANHALHYYGVDGIYIGRAALKNPFIFEQCRAIFFQQPLRQPTSQDYHAVLDRLKTHLEHYFPPHLSLLHARKFLSWISSGFPGASEYRSQLYHPLPEDAFWQKAKDFFTQTPPLVPKILQEVEPFLMGGHG